MVFGGGSPHLPLLPAIVDLLFSVLQICILNMAHI